MSIQFEQLDLFTIAESNEREALKASCTLEPQDFRIGDRFNVKWRNGVEFTGLLSARGWWSEREDLKNYHWLDIGGDYRHFDPYTDDWTYLGRDEEYQPPRTDDIEERLVKVLSSVEADKRIATYQQFERQYPYLSADYHELISEAWDKAIVKVTSLKQFLSLRKTWTCPAQIDSRLRKLVLELVKEIFQESRDQWKNELLKIRWTEGGKENRYVRGFSKKDYTYWRPFYQHYLTECNTPNELLTLMEMRGEDSYWELETPSEPKVWKEE